MRNITFQPMGLEGLLSAALRDPPVCCIRHLRVVTCGFRVESVWKVAISYQMEVRMFEQICERDMVCLLSSGKTRSCLVGSFDSESQPRMATCYCVGS